MSHRMDATEQAAHALASWERNFKRAARADDFAIFRSHLQRLALPNKPRLMLDWTVALVRRCSSYLALDGRDKAIRQLLGVQTYDPAKATKACYTCTFDLCGKAVGRVLAEADLLTLDLADLYGSPWPELRVVGFHNLWISHPDWRPLTKKEVRHLQAAVTDDLRYDYAEDEINFWFDDSLSRSYLLVTVQDVD